MKTLHLAIIIGIGITVTVLGNSIAFAQTNETGPEPQPVKDWLATHPHFFGCVHTDLKTGESKEVTCLHPELSPMGMYEPQNNMHVMSPLKQFKSGIKVQDVKCEQGYVLTLKSEDGSPVCVTPTTAQKLVERGWAKNQISASTLEKPSIGLYNVTTSLQPVILGMSFFINAEVVNNQNTSITYYGGCISPISISFDNIQTHTDAMHCLAMSKYVLGPHERVSIQSDKINSVYNGTGPDYANAELKFQYENNGTKTSWFTSAEFPIQHAIKLTCSKSFQSQIEEINKSVNIKKAIALAHSSPEFLSKVKRYGNVSYMSFYNDLFPDQSCNAYWKGIEVMFTANDKNGVRNIQVSEDINLTKVIKIEDFQAITN